MKRSDGTRLTSLDPFVEMIPYIMERRSDAQNFAKRIFFTEPIDRYILEKKEEGRQLRYLHLFIAASVRVLAERPQLNRFIMSSRIYQRKGISISMAIKRSFREDGEETTVKFQFTGQETIFEMAQIIDAEIAKALSHTATEEDQLIQTMMSLPHFVKKILVKTLKGLDKLNLLPESLIKISPFHTSLFITHLKSIKSDYIFHHLYDFGTTGIFMALGKNMDLPVVEGHSIVIKNCVQVGITTDERICDGVYMTRSFRLLEKYISDPKLLEQRPARPVSE